MSGPVGDRLIITNGDVAAGRVEAVGIDADILPWRDVLHDGPVPGGLTLEDLSEVRAGYLAEEFGLWFEDVLQNFAARDAAIRDHGTYDLVELWFEHDLYDQLQLLQLIDFFRAEGRFEGVALVQAGDYLGELDDEALRALEPTARAITPDDFDIAARAWAAFTAPTPQNLGPLADADVPALPYLGSAVRRLLLELPAVGSGLSLTEERVLMALHEAPRTVGDLFGMTQSQEAARFLADVPFLRRIDELALAPTPLIEGLPFGSRHCSDTSGEPDYGAIVEATVALTEAGRASLAGEFDHACENAIERWLGGTHLTAATMWRRDRDGGLVAP